VQAAQLSSRYLLRFRTNTFFCDSSEQICDPLVLRPPVAATAGSARTWAAEGEVRCRLHPKDPDPHADGPRSPLPAPNSHRRGHFLTSVRRPFQSPFMPMNDALTRKWYDHCKTHLKPENCQLSGIPYVLTSSAALASLYLRRLKLADKPRERGTT